MNRWLVVLFVLFSGCSTASKYENCTSHSDQVRDVLVLICDLPEGMKTKPIRILPIRER